MTFGVVVCFRGPGGVWSKEYTYKSEVPFKEGDAVVVPAGTFWNVAKVKRCVENYKFNEAIAYKSIHCKLAV